MGKLSMTLAAVVILVVVIQFFQPAKTNPHADPALSIASQVEIPVSIAAMLNAACRDCHSNNTVWPLHSYISPVSWLVDRCWRQYPQTPSASICAPGAASGSRQLLHRDILVLLMENLLHERTFSG